MLDLLSTPMLDENDVCLLLPDGDKQVPCTAVGSHEVDSIAPSRAIHSTLIEFAAVEAAERYRPDVSPLR
jgi:hypothetical protein